MPILNPSAKPRMASDFNTSHYIQLLKMEPTEGSETSAALKLTPGKYPKEDIQHSKPDEILKSR
jgi:hypothetical protein